MVSADCTVRWTGKCHCGGCISGMQPVMSAVCNAALHRLAIMDKKHIYDYSETMNAFSLPTSQGSASSCRENRALLSKLGVDFLRAQRLRTGCSEGHRISQTHKSRRERPICSTMCAACMCV